MQFLQLEEVSVDVEEISVSSAARGPPGWRVKMHINDGRGLSLRKETSISDPLKKESDHSKLRIYLNETLENAFTPDNKDIEDKLESYPRKLSAGLNLDTYSTCLNGKKLNVWIRGISEISCVRSIHSLHWELLENLSLWVNPKDSMSVRPASVTVRRCVKDHLVPTCQVRIGKSEVFNVLLVVARKNIHKKETDYFNPTSVLRAILGVQAEIECRWLQKRIRLEVVRPGSYKELEIHLQRSHKEFQIVHFDVHGGIDSGMGAHLIFNQYATNGHQLVEGKVAASDIAKLLLDNGIRCAVLSSCKTAVADTGVQANLSWSFLQKGMASVLAFSYNIPDTMSKIFFPCFYHEFFVNHREFADAAAIAREKLCRSPDRWSYVQKDFIKLQDWFIPKVYSNGEPWYIGKKPNLAFAFWIWISTLKSQLLSVIILTFVVEMLVWSPSVDFLTPFMNLDKDTSIKWARHSLFVSCLISCLILLATFMSRHWTKWRSVRRLETIDRDRTNILRIEGDLRRSHQILLHTVNDEKNTAHKLLDTLSHVWCRTHLVQHRVIIKAEWFLQPFPWDISTGWDWSRLPRSIGHILQLWAQGFSSGLAQLSRRDEEEAKTVFVVTNVKALFPGESQEQTYHQNAQIRFRGWLERYFGFGGIVEGRTRGVEDASPSPSPLPNYLVLIWKGWGGPPKPLFEPESLGGPKTSKRIIVTDYINPEKFQHNLERPLIQHDKL